MRYLLPLVALAILMVSGQRFLAQQKDPPKDPGKEKEKDPPAKEEEKEPDTTAEDTKMLKDLGLTVEGPALLDYFKKRTFKEADPKQLEVLIKNLGDEDFVVRERASADLAQLGSSALVALKQVAEKSKDPEAKKRANDLKSKIEAKQEPGIQMAVARMIARLQPEAAAEVLINYLPFAPDRTVTDEICKALGAVAVVKGKAEAAVMQALDDKLPLKRGAAAEALARAKSDDHLPAVRKLLKDADASVRLRTALALANRREKEVIPVLVDLLKTDAKEMSFDDLSPAQEILALVAGEKDAPTASVGTTDAERKACHEAWAAWLKKNPDIDLAKVDLSTAMLGYTLIVQQGNQLGGRPPTGEVFEIDRQKKKKWKFNVQTYPVDAQVVGRDRILIAEYQGARVTERDFKGNVTWELNVGNMGINPIGVQKLPNGNVFVVAQQQVVEFDRKGKEVYKYQRFNDNIFRARKHKNGEILMISNTGNLIRLDPKNNKEIKVFFAGHPNNLFGGFDIAPNGNVIVTQQNNNKVIEFTLDGKEVKSFNVQQPNSVVRLPNGHLLVSSNNVRRITELDRSGREVWSHTCDDGTPWIARRR